MSALARLLALLCTAVLTACEDPHEAGRTVYNARCYFCHGYSGDARTVAAASLQPPPRDFTAAGAGLTRERIEQAVRHGVPGTAMTSFGKILSDAEMRSVAAFVEREFVRERAPNTRYHTPANGWPDHERYAEAFPFATGARSAAEPLEALDEAGRRGKRLYLTACVTCHDRGAPAGEAPPWETRAVSYPVNTAACLSCHNREGIRAAAAQDAGDPHSRHDRAPQLPALSEAERRGEGLYQANCAFCHAADGTGRNWIGTFLEPHAADFTAGAFRERMTRAGLRAAIGAGKPGSSMPAWRSVLSPGEIDAVAAYVERAFTGPLAAFPATGKDSRAFPDSATRRGAR
ncbi:MAG TPA: c-type cytochrome [Burkholderiales bacterium]